MATALIDAMLRLPGARTAISGTAFLADSYDLFVMDGVTSILKALGPAVAVHHAGETFYFTSYCHDTTGTSCLPRVFNNATGSWEPNPTTTWTPDFTPRYQTQTAELKSLVSTAAVVGSIIGQLAFGAAGDALGRKWAFVASSVLLVLGSAGSATALAGATVACPSSLEGMCTAPAGSTPAVSNVYLQLALWRALLGLGIGGEYPLAATVASEGAQAATRGRAVATVFAQQGIGKVVGALAAYASVAASSYYRGAAGVSLEWAWRLVLLAGALPNLVTLPFRWRLEESAIFRKAAIASASGMLPLRDADEYGDEEGGGAAARPSAPTAAGGPPGSVGGRLGSSFRGTAATLWAYKWTLVGTASTWALLDVTFYSQGLLSSTLAQSALAGGATGGGAPMDRLASSLLTTVWVVLIALPGYFLSILTLDSWGRRRIQVMGFAMQVALFAALAGGYTTPLRTAAGGVGFIILYGLSFLFANFGPNATTFVVPSEAFPTRARATAHGISAACGKVGAAVGASALLELWYSHCVSSLDGSGQPNCGLVTTVAAESDAGVVAVMWACAAVSAAGLLVTLALTKETAGRALEEMDRAGGETVGLGAGKAHDAWVAAVAAGSGRLLDDLWVVAAGGSPGRGARRDGGGAAATPGGTAAVELSPVSPRTTTGPRGDAAAEAAPSAATSLIMPAAERGRGGYGSM